LKKHNLTKSRNFRQWRSKEGKVGARAPGAQALGAHQHTFSAFKNMYLSRNLDQNEPKTAYFLENC